MPIEAEAELLVVIAGHRSLDLESCKTPTDSEARVRHDYFILLRETPVS